MQRFDKSWSIELAAECGVGGSGTFSVASENCAVLYWKSVCVRSVQEGVRRYGDSREDLGVLELIEI